MQRLAIALVLLIGLAPSAFAKDAATAADVTRKMVDSVLEVLKQEALTTQARRDRIMEIITPVFDFPLMGKLALGKSHWPKLNDAQRETYTHLFVDQLRGSYSDKVELFSDEKVTFAAPVQVGTKVQVETTVLSKDERTKLLYKLYESGDTWKIYDVEIDGVSIVSSYRAQYDQVLRENSVDDFLARLREKQEKRKHAEADDGK